MNNLTQFISEEREQLTNLYKNGYAMLNHDRAIDELERAVELIEKLEVLWRKNSEQDFSFSQVTYEGSSEALALIEEWRK